MGTQPSGGVVSAVQARRPFGLGCRTCGMTRLVQIMRRAARILPARLNPRNSDVTGAVRRQLGGRTRGYAAGGSATPGPEGPPHARRSEPWRSHALRERHVVNARRKAHRGGHGRHGRGEELQLPSDALDLLPSRSLPVPGMVGTPTSDFAQDVKPVRVWACAAPLGRSAHRPSATALADDAATPAGT